MKPNFSARSLFAALAVATALGAPSAPARAAQSNTAARSARSQAIAAALPPSAAIRAAAMSNSAWRRATSTTAAPAAASARAISPPMPELPPVTRAQRPLRSNRFAIEGCILPTP